MEPNVLIRKTGMYSRVPIPLVRNNEISNQAKIVYMQLASHTDGWTIYVKKLANDCQLTEATLRKYIKELEEHGYVVRERIKENGLLKGYNWELVEYPSQPNQQETTASATDAQKPKKANKKKYGRYNNVPFTDEQLEKLQTEFPQTWEERIERVSVWADSKNKTVKDGLATIRNWARKNNDYEQPKQKATERDDWL